MAKGDKDAVNSAINAEQPRMNQQRSAYGAQLQGDINQSRDQGQQTYNSAYGNLNQASQGFGNIAAGGNFTPMNSSFINQDLDSMKNAEALFNQFIGTGGYSDSDVRNMRARAEAPTTAIYANAQSELNRNRALQGGYSPNYGAASAKMAREMSNQIGQADIANEATLAQNIAGNKLSGAQGMTQLGLGKANARTNAEQLAEQSRQFGAGLQLQGNQGLASVGNGLTNLYGTGNANLNTQLGLLGNNISGQQAGNLGLINARIGAAGVASDNQNALANAGSLMNLAGQGANMLNAYSGGSKSGGTYTGGTQSGGWDRSGGYDQSGNGWVGDGSYFPGMDTGFGGYGDFTDPGQYGNQYPPGYFDTPPPTGGMDYYGNSPTFNEMPQNTIPSFTGYDPRNNSGNTYDEYGQLQGYGNVDPYNIYSGGFTPQGSQAALGTAPAIAYDPTQDPNFWGS